MDPLRERALAAYEKDRLLTPHYRSVMVENWIAEEFDIDCDPVAWETEWEGEVSLGDISLWVRATEGWIIAWLMWRCPHCGMVDKGRVVDDLVGLGRALQEERTFCSRCGKPYASH